MVRLGARAWPPPAPSLASLGSCSRVARCAFITCSSARSALPATVPRCGWGPSVACFFSRALPRSRSETALKIWEGAAACCWSSGAVREVRLVFVVHRPPQLRAARAPPPPTGARSSRSPRSRRLALAAFVFLVRSHSLRSLARAGPAQQRALCRAAAAQQAQSHASPSRRSPLPLLIQPPARSPHGRRTRASRCAHELDANQRRRARHRGHARSLGLGRAGRRLRPARGRAGSRRGVGSDGQVSITANLVPPAARSRAACAVPPVQAERTLQSPLVVLQRLAGRGARPGLRPLQPGAHTLRLTRATVPVPPSPSSRPANEHERRPRLARRHLWRRAGPLLALPDPLVHDAPPTFRTSSAGRPLQERARARRAPRRQPPSRARPRHLAPSPHARPPSPFGTRLPLRRTEQRLGRERLDGLGLVLGRLRLEHVDGARREPPARHVPAAAACAEGRAAVPEAATSAQGEEGAQGCPGRGSRSAGRERGSGGGEEGGRERLDGRALGARRRR